MSKQNESQGMRDSTVAETTATGSWDPYQVWLTRVKNPRDGRQPASAAESLPTVVPAATTTVKVAPADLSETARLRALTFRAS